MSNPYYGQGPTPGPSYYYTAQPQPHGTHYPQQSMPAPFYAPPISQAPLSGLPAPRGAPEQATELSQEPQVEGPVGTTGEAPTLTNLADEERRSRWWRRKAYKKASAQLAGGWWTSSGFRVPPSSSSKKPVRASKKPVRASKGNVRASKGNDRSKWVKADPPNFNPFLYSMMYPTETAESWDEAQTDWATRRRPRERQMLPRTVPGSTDDKWPSSADESASYFTKYNAIGDKRAGFAHYYKMLNKPIKPKNPAGPTQPAKPFTLTDHEFEVLMSLEFAADKKKTAEEKEQVPEGHVSGRGGGADELEEGEIEEGEIVEEESMGGRGGAKGAGYDRGRY